MTVLDAKKLAAQYLDIYDARTKGILRDKKVTDTMLSDYADYVIRDEAFGEVKREFKELFTRKFYLNNWEWTGTLTTGSTYTINVGSSVFDSTHVGSYLYNNNLGVASKITKYNSATSVDLQLSVGSTWNGHTIYLLSGRVHFRGNLSELIDPDYVAIKYNTSATSHTKAENQASANIQSDFFPDPSQVSESYPVWNTTSNRDLDTTDYVGIEFFPKPQKPVTGGVYLEGTVFLPKLTDDSEIPFPKGHHLFIAYGIAVMGSEPMQKSVSFIQRQEKKFQFGLTKLKKYYRPRKEGRMISYRERMGD